MSTTQHSILITGGTGLIGMHLSRTLQNKGYAVRHLSRKRQLNAEFPAYSWQIESEYIDPDAFDDSVKTIIHLAGTSISQRWTSQQKNEIVESRVKSTNLLTDYLQNQLHSVTTFIGGSATGYYGNSGGESKSETDLPADHSFLSTTTQLWENAYLPLQTVAQLRSVLLRIGVVLTSEGGALPEMAKATRWGIAAYLGNGKQYMPWIHIDDLCNLFLFAIENPHLQGIYNAVAPQPIRHKLFMQTLARHLSGYAWAIPVPALALRATMGEMADIVLHGCRANSQKIEQAGFQFLYPDLDNALKNIYRQ
jgi:uncharacterized protein (TIGR01777 family)